MKKNSFVVLALAGATIMALTGCNKTASGSSTNPQNLPDNAQAVADKVASLAAICQYSNGQTLKAGEANSNIVPVGKVIFAAKSYTIQAWDGSKGVDVTATLAWTVSDKAVLKVGTKDDTHIQISPMTPYYQQPDFSGTLNCTVTYNEKTATVLFNVKVLALTSEPADYKDMSKLRTSKAALAVTSNSWVKAYGYVTGFLSDKSKVYIQSGSYGAVVYGSGDKFPSTLKIGDLYVVTGMISEYYGALELQYSVSATAYTGTDVPAVKETALTEDLLKKCTDSGWIYGACLVSATAKLTDTKGNFTVGATKFAAYNKFLSDADWTTVKGLFTTANQGKDFTVKGVGDSYKGLAEFYPTAVSDIALAA